MLSRDQDLDDEIGHDLAMEVEDGIRAGLSREEAEWSARRSFGNVGLVKETIRGTWKWTWIERLGQDLRFAARTMRRGPGFSIAAIVSLALGIGAATALFSVVHALLIVPHNDSHPVWRLIVSDVTNPAEWVPLRQSQYMEIKKLPAFSEVAAVGWEGQILTGGRPAESVHTALVSGNVFQFAGVAPLLGRTILPADTDPAGRVAVLSYGAWQRWFHGRPDVLGKTLVLNDLPHEVIGVMPPRFGWREADVWLPLPADRRGFVSIQMRLRSGVSKKTAERQLQALFSHLAQEDPRRFPRVGCATRLASDDAVGEEMRSALRWLIVLVSFLLLIACANVANLQLARLTVRSREIAVRLALGADGAVSSGNPSPKAWHYHSPVGRWECYCPWPWCGRRLL